MNKTSTKEILRDAIIYRTLWYKWQCCRLASHLFFGNLGRAYASKKRQLKRRVEVVQEFLRGGGGYSEGEEMEQPPTLVNNLENRLESCERNVGSTLRDSENLKSRLESYEKNIESSLRNDETLRSRLESCEKNVESALRNAESLKGQLRNCVLRTNSLWHGPRFIYSNSGKFSVAEWVRYCSDKFFGAVGYYPDLKNPRTFMEKLNWLKYHYYNPINNYCVDKYTAKLYFADKVGSEYVLPCLGVWEDVNDIDFDKLPDRVVFKNTVSGGDTGVRIIKNLRGENINKLKFTLNRLLFNVNNDIWTLCLVPERQLIKQRLIAEDYVEDEDGMLRDYKFFCFHGKPKFLYVCEFVLGSPVLVFLDLNWQPTPFQHTLYKQLSMPKKPKNFEKMVEISEKLSEGHPFCRVDLYNVDGRILVGEMTFNPTGGYIRFNDKKYDYEIGEMLDLSLIDKKYLTDDIASVIAREPIVGYHLPSGS